MLIEINLSPEKIILSLKKQDTVLDMITFATDNGLSHLLLENINKLIQKNGLDAGKIEKITLESTLPENFTSFRIAKSVVDSFNFASKKA